MRLHFLSLLPGLIDMAELAVAGFAAIVIGAPILALWMLFKEEYEHDQANSD